ncbi:MAG: hypothetical protein Q9169_002150 [Polycauliona sp. 2 TL-2023]
MVSRTLIARWKPRVILLRLVLIFKPHSQRLLLRWCRRRSRTLRRHIGPPPSPLTAIPRESGLDSDEPVYVGDFDDNPLGDDALVSPTILPPEEFLRVEDAILNAIRSDDTIPDILLSSAPARTIADPATNAHEDMEEDTEELLAADGSDHLAPISNYRWLSEWVQIAGRLWDNFLDDITV